MRPDPVPGWRASGVNRPDVLQRKGRLSAAAGASRPAGSGGGRAPSWRRCRRRWRRPDGSSATASASRWWRRRLCRTLCRRRPGNGACRCRRAERRRAASLPDLLHRLVNVFERAFGCSPARRCWCRAEPAASASPRSSWPRRPGATVIVTAGSDDRVRRLRRRSAPTRDQLPHARTSAEVLRLIAPSGVDVILDMVAGDYVAAREVNCLAEDGRIVIIAVQGGGRCGLDAGLVLRRPGRHRLDAAPALVALQRRRSPMRCARTVWP